MKRSDNSYNSLSQLVQNAEQISWSRFNSFLVFNSILLFLWGVMVSEINLFRFVLMLIINVIGIMSGITWAMLGYRGRKHVSYFISLGADIESEMDYKYRVFKKLIDVRESTRFRRFGSYLRMTKVPLIHALFHFVLLVFIIIQMIWK